MPNIIHIETSTSVCSAALSSDGVVQCHFENFEGPSHASLLGVYVKQIMDFSRDKGVKVDAVAVSSGPGSCPMIDARRMEVYSAVFDNALNDVVPVGAYVIDEHTFSDLLDNRRIVFAGNGSTKCKDVIKHRNAIFVEGIVPLATDMLALAERAFRNGQFEDVAYFEPFYLKEFIATTPKNKIL